MRFTSLAAVASLLFVFATASPLRNGFPSSIPDKREASKGSEHPDVLKRALFSDVEGNDQEKIPVVKRDEKFANPFNAAYKREAEGKDTKVHEDFLPSS